MTTVARLRSDESLAAEGINLKALQSISGTVMIPGRADSVERIHLTDPYGNAPPRFYRSTITAADDVFDEIESVLCLYCALPQVYVHCSLSPMRTREDVYTASNWRAGLYY